MASIILIEDEKLIRTALDKGLTSVGHSVRCAANGREGLAMYQAEAADVVITDIVMPVMDGLEAIQAILAFDPQATIVAMSGSSSGTSGYDYLTAARKFGAARTLSKPTGVRALREIVEELLAADTTASTG